MNINVKHLSLSLLSLAICLIFFSACSSAKPPEGFSEDEVKEKAASIVAMINAKDFSGVEKSMNAKLSATLSADKLEAALSALLDNLGNYKETTSTTLAAKQDPETNEDYVVVIVIANYDNGKAQYTLSLNQDLELIGLYMK